jgi:carboxymethylenebutenolidase
MCRSSRRRSASTAFRRKEFADPAMIRIPFQAHFASKDDWCTPAAVDALEAAMRRPPAIPPEAVRYEADHAFFNDAARRGL